MTAVLGVDIFYFVVSCVLSSLVSISSPDFRKVRWMYIAW